MRTPHCLPSCHRRRLLKVQLLAVAPCQQTTGCSKPLPLFSSQRKLFAPSLLLLG